MYRPLLLAACAAGALLPFAASAQHHHDMPMPIATPAKAPAKTATAKRRAAPARTRVSRPPASAAATQVPVDANETMSHGDHPAPASERTATPDHASMHIATSDAANSGGGDRGASPAGIDHPGMNHSAMNQSSMNHMGGAHAGMDHAMSFTAPPAWRQASDAALAHAPVGAAMSGMTMGTAGGWYTPGSGTARLPAAEGPMRGAMFSVGDWMVMAHGYAWGTLTDQGGPRGGNMAFVQSMAMLMADRDLSDRVHLQLRGMGSLEPLMGRRGYPNLFATGETANGVPLVDRQHPHDLFMELAARLDYRLDGDTSLFLYGGPVGEPALGPSAFMHRGSARYQPLSPITHHWFDSTHITYGVVTAGLSAPRVQLEGSWFKGREPDERRWDIDPIRLDSWSLRGTWTPSPYLAVQVSHAHLKEPEAQHPGEDENRTTASVQWAQNGVSTTFAWSRKDRQPGDVLNAWLAEATWEITPRHAVFVRLENVANDELFPDHDDPLHDRRFRVTKAEGGYAYRLPIVGPLGVALGGTVAAYAKPDALDDAYGRTPVSWTLFAKLAVGL
ncbi:hypothetical protein [uncultured Sphingomonas sp.]|uniref:hypothetical protein n=1 Tax=uncultured Sphingomonas sp. TaxID=158754 RepID=UPI0025FC3394|nr:hypothetical protein [uncultured Sphingomonas sp.]